ncbi:hypothetical protein [Variovorax sp. dw_954]|uniref:hypothetical protein n=1 Tax=Variovorax sp. dw_954 TaxID=2720078 RepID=UPI001BD264A3|nr:hypothetical protein [Variovorax sp. dw_954]
MSEPAMLEVIAKTLGRLVMSGLLLVAWHAYKRHADGSSSGDIDAWNAMEYGAAFLLVWAAYPVLARFAGPDAEKLQQQAAMPEAAWEIACENASARAIAQYGRSAGVSQTCPLCKGLVSVRAVDGGMWLSVATDCACHRCAGKFRLPSPRARSAAVLARGRDRLRGFDVPTTQPAQLLPDTSSEGQSRM